MPAWIAQQIVVRAFYARADTWRPMLLGTVVALAAIPLYLLLGDTVGVLGLAGAGAVGMSVNALATLLLARWLHGAPDLASLFGTTARATVIAVVAAVLVERIVVVEAANGVRGALLQLGAGGMLFAVVTLVGTFTLGDEPMRAAVRRMLRR